MKYSIYTKFCIKCIAEKELQYFEKWCDINKYKYEIKRTTYMPELHKEASRYWGDEKYTMFVRDNETENNIDFYEFIKQIKQSDKPKTIKKSKPVKECKKK